MKFIIVGAGAVGAVIGTLLQGAGHDVQFWVRPSRRAVLSSLSSERLQGPRLRIEAPRCLCAGDAPPASDWVLVCVRGEQLDAALREVVAQLGAERRVAVATVSLSGVTARARRAGLRGEVYALHVSFASYASAEEPPSFTWFPFAPPTMITPERVRAHLPMAQELARTLRQAGLPTRSALSMTTTMSVLVALNSVLALAWDLCDWELARLARHALLRPETAQAMHEAVRLIVPARSPFLLLRRQVFAVFLRVFPWFFSRRARELWLRHGPKIRAQTAYVARELLAQALAEHKPTPALSRLFSRFVARFPV